MLGEEVFQRLKTLEDVSTDDASRMMLPEEEPVDRCSCVTARSANVFVLQPALMTRKSSVDIKCIAAEAHISPRRS